MQDPWDLVMSMYNNRLPCEEQEKNGQVGLFPTGSFFTSLVCWDPEVAKAPYAHLFLGDSSQGEGKMYWQTQQITHTGALKTYNIDYFSNY